MKILWVCNVVLNDFADEYQIKKKPFGGWMEGMLHELEKREEIIVGLCFPIIDEARIKSGVHGGHPYYSFHASIDVDKYDDCMFDEFRAILNDFQPDVIHIWGTEYKHSWAMVNACNALEIIDKVLIHIQGLVSFCAIHYALGIPEKYVFAKCGALPSIYEEIADYQKRGINEKKTLKYIKHITGRTEWDKNCVRQVNKLAKYHFCNENLRDCFYKAEKWDITKCLRHSIFISQASYPVKGLHYFLQAIPMLCEKYHDLTVYIGGNDPTQQNKNGEISPYGVYLLELIEKLDVKDKIRFLGQLPEEEIIAQYLSANVFVSPSVIENSSNSISEAMLLGTPVVASYVGGTPSIIYHGKDGFLYPCDAYYMMAMYIGSIFDDDVLAMRLSKNGIETATERHDCEKNADRLIKIYQGMIG